MTEVGEKTVSITYKRGDGFFEREYAGIDVVKMDEDGHLLIGVSVKHREGTPQEYRVVDYFAAFACGEWIRWEFDRE